MVMEVVQSLRHETLGDGTGSFKVLKDGQSMYLSDTVIYEDNQRFNFVPEDLDSLPAWYIFIRSLHACNKFNFSIQGILCVELKLSYGSVAMATW